LLPDGKSAIQAASLISIITYAKRTNSELHIIFCDIAKAFDKVPQAALSKALRLHGFPEELILRVEALQACEEAATRTPYGHSQHTCPITMGCKQGCPMSPIGFCHLAKWDAAEYSQVLSANFRSHNSWAGLPGLQYSEVLF
jgi:hypothetical protein